MKESSFENTPGNEKTLPPALQDIVDKQKYIRDVLEKLKNFDQITYEHTIETARLISLIAKDIGLDEEESALLIEAALAHDIGKTAVDPKILFKKTELDEKDWEKVKQHVHDSFTYIDKNGRNEVAKIAVAHHDHDDSKSASRTKKERRKKNIPVESDKRTGEDRRTANAKQLKPPG